MPGKVGVKIKAGRNLPVMDRGSDTTDAYVEIKLGNTTYKTDVCRKSLNPQWNTDWYRFEVDDAELQDEPLQIRLMDHDTYSANDAIGKVNISLNPLCIENAGQVNPGKGAVMSGWIPVFDTMHGIRGEVNVIVKVDLFSDANKFRQSSCGVQFFHSSNIPHGYRAQVIHGFVEELVVNDDPEYQWIDKIRTPRASNEARQVVFLKLSGQVQRKIGLKAINLGANAVIGYTQCFDLEGDVGVVARGIGTAVTLVRIQEIATQPVLDNALIEERTLKYLEFLKGDYSVDVNLRSKFDSDVYNTDTGDIVYKILGIDPIEKCATKIPSIILTKKWHPSAKDEVILEEGLEEDESISKLLDQEDMRGEKMPRRFRHHVKRVARSSKNKLSDKFNAFKAKMNEDKFDVGSGSLGSSASDLSFSGSLRSSISDLRDFIAKKTEKKSTFHRSVSDGCGMATVLVRSIMSGPTLDVPSEDIRDGHLRPSGSIRKNKSLKSESLTDLPSKQKQKETSSAIMPSDDPSSSLVSYSITTTASSSSEASSDEEDDDEEEEEEEESEILQKEVMVVDADTVSMVVKSVLAKEATETDSDKWIKPTSNENDEDFVLKARYMSKKLISEKGEDSSGTGTVQNIADEIHRRDIAQKNSAMENFLRCKIDEVDSEKWIEPGSTVSDPEVVAGERRGSLLQDIKENLTERFHQFQEHLLKSHPGEIQNKHGLVEAAMETMLAEKAALVGASPPPTPPPFEIDDKIQNKKGEKRRKGFEMIMKKLRFPFRKRNKEKADEIKHESGMLDTAVQSILMEQANIAEEIVEHMSEHSSSSKETGITVRKGCENTYSSNSLNDDHVDLEPMKHDNISESDRDTNSSILHSHEYRIDNDLKDSFHSSHPHLTTDRQLQSISTKPAHTSLIDLKFSCASSVQKMPEMCTNQIEAPQSAPTILDPNDKFPSSNKFLSNIKQNNLVDASDSVLSSSYTNLCTNKAPMLAPFPSLGENRSELSSASASPGGKTITTTTAATTTTTSASSTAITTLASGHTRAESAGSKINPHSPAKVGVSAPVASTSTKDTGICRRSSDSDLSVTPKGNSLGVASERLVAATQMMRLNTGPSLKTALNQENLDMLEYPFLTIAKYPPGFIVHIGATVAARSVKLLERVPNPDEPETRDSWWTELRMEIRSHARALACNVVLGYSEVTTISDDVCVLSATGTAAVINMSYSGDMSQMDVPSTSKKDLLVSSLEDRETTRESKNVKTTEGGDVGAGTNETTPSLCGSVTKETMMNIPINFGCVLCHIPYSQASVPFNVKMRKCAVCKRGRVPDVLLSTIEIPDSLQITGRGCFLQAQVVRCKKDLRSESNAKEISDGLPFLEYELHRLLINKLKAKGMNAIFGLKADVAIGEKLMALVATGTAVYLTALPPPSCPKIVAGNSWTDTAKLTELQKSLQETIDRNREIYQLKSVDPDAQNGKQAPSDTDDSDDEIQEIDLTTGNKDTCVLEVDDIEDLEIIALLMEPCCPDGFHVVNTQSVPGLHDIEVVRNLQMFSQVWRSKLTVGHNVSNFPKHFQRLLQTICFKLRSMIPCAICDLRFRLDLPESDEIQLLVTGMALGLTEPTKHNKMRRKTISNGNNKKATEEELIFSLDEDQLSDAAGTVVAAAAPVPGPSNQLNTNFGTHSLRLRKNSPSRTKFSSVRYSRHVPIRERYGIDITPSSYVPGGKIEKYLGNLNFFFIRESTSVRENGGISGFVHSFITELLAVVRAHITALGGNAMVAFYMTELILVDNPHKNQGQCLVSIGGDVVYVSYYTDD